MAFLNSNQIVNMVTKTADTFFIHAILQSYFISFFNPFFVKLNIQNGSKLLINQTVLEK